MPNGKTTFSDGLPFASQACIIRSLFYRSLQRAIMKQTLKLSLTALAAACALAACKQETSTPATSAASGSAANTAASAAAKDASALGTPEQQASYAMGIDIGRSFKKMKEQGTW